MTQDALLRLRAAGWGEVDQRQVQDLAEWGRGSAGPWDRHRPRRVLRIGRGRHTGPPQRGDAARSSSICATSPTAGFGQVFDAQPKHESP